MSETKKLAREEKLNAAVFAFGCSDVKKNSRAPARTPTSERGLGALEPPWCRWSVCNRVPPLDACAATAADLTITAQERQISEPNVRHEGGRARHRGWARWNRRCVVGRCATGCPRSTRAPRPPRT